MFVVFLLIARHIELKSRITSTALLDRSAKIIPQTAKRMSHAGVEEIPVIELTEGDKIQLAPGETLPVDGRLLSAKSSFDESLITGESLPVTHTSGDFVLGGSINIEQLIEVEVYSSKANSTLNAIQQLAQRSTHFKPYYVDIAEGVATKFVAIILLIATATFLFWFWKDDFNNVSNALSHTISVLIVTCPCALALAAPVALSLGAAGLNRLHLLAVKMSSIEKLSQIDTIVFDKTGTLTTGEPTLKSVKATADFGSDKCVQIAASMEQNLYHPFAKAIIKYYAETSQETGGMHFLKASKLELITGQGVDAVFNSEQWHLGNEKFISTFLKNNNNRFTLTHDLANQIKAWRAQGKSILYLANTQALQAVFCIQDPQRAGLESFLKQVKELGIKRQVILSGDHQQSVDAIAKQVGISEAYGGMSPQQKLEWVSDLQQKSKYKIMMLGDGINDAPTLAVADVSLTFSEATDLAKNNCDFILLGKDFRYLGKAFQLMRKTRSIILQNLGWAIAYNIIAIPLAAMGWITPWMAAIGMSLSSLLVVLNSMRLR
jgi:Cu2+-exporting ATPase